MKRENNNHDVQDNCLVRKVRPRFKLKELKDSALLRNLGGNDPNPNPHPACMFMGRPGQ